MQRDLCLSTAPARECAPSAKQRGRGAQTQRNPQAQIVGAATEACSVA